MEESKRKHLRGKIEDGYLVFFDTDGKEVHRKELTVQKKRKTTTIEQTTKITIVEEVENTLGNVSIELDEEVISHILQREETFTDWVSNRREKQKRRESLRPINVAKALWNHLSGRGNE